MIDSIGTLNVNLPDIMPPQLILHVTVRVKGVWRLRFGAALIRLAGWIMGTKFILSTGEDDIAPGHGKPVPPPPPLPPAPPKR